MGTAGRSGAALLVAISAALPRPGAAQEPSLDAVLARAAGYVAAFQQQLSGIVSEETYSQEVTPLLSTSRTVRVDRRTLKSDLLLVRPEGSDRYVEFRDVFEVDGRPVRDRQDRLTRLFLEPSASSDAQVQAIITQSARYNIGDVQRTMNTPMLAIGFLLPAYQPQFRFEPARNRLPDVATRSDSALGTAAAFGVTSDMWVIAFRESLRPTLIRTLAGADFPAQGRFWVDPATGAVLMTELVLSSPDVEAVVDVSYQSARLLGFRVPVAMRERYHVRTERMAGAATYGRFRTFQVRTDEAIAAPDVPGPKPPEKKPPAPHPNRA